MKEQITEAVVILIVVAIITQTGNVNYIGEVMAKYVRSRRLDIERSKAVIEALGGTTKLAREFGICHPSVSGWKREGIPEDRLQYIQLKYRRVQQVRDTLDFHPWTERQKGVACVTTE